MRWSIVRLIWLRELRDQLRDRRTLFMIAVLPLLLYPLAGLGLMQLALGFLKQQNVVLVYGAEHLPDADATARYASRLWLTSVPDNPGAPLASVARAVTATALDRVRPYPPLLVRADGGRSRFPTEYLDNPDETGLVVRTAPLPAAAARTLTAAALVGEIDWPLYGNLLAEQWVSSALDPLRTPLDRREVDLILIVPPDLPERLEHNATAPLHLLTRSGDERSRLVNSRITSILSTWKYELKETRLARHGLPARFDRTVEVRDPERARPVAQRAAGELFGLVARIFPFVLVMWSLAGALYPAIDLCAGEKERGTMETLLISPASREEIVWGKFLTIWLFSAATALLNLLSMGLTTWQFSRHLPQDPFRLSSLFWGVVLLLPLSAFFSALSLAIGAYARSSKEGQYYLMPLFLVTMPLVCLTLAPGIELNAFYCLVPVTGVALLLQKLMIAGTPSAVLWLYFVPVLAPMVIYSWLALRWAIEQFQREEVLFREAERLDLGLWLKRLWRDKEALPSGGQALFCFALILSLRWLAMGLAGRGSLLALTAVSHLAFVATPALFMALLLTTRPLRGLGLRWPPLWSWPAAVLLAGATVVPLSLLTQALLEQLPGLKLALQQGHALPHELQKLLDASLWLRAQYFLVLAVLPAICEELAFRGFILCGLLRRFKPWTAILLSSFLFALYQMNVFQFLPHFVFGVVLAILVQRSGSIGPAIVFHLLFNSLLMLPLLAPEWFQGLQMPSASAATPSFSLALSLVMVLLAVLCTAVALTVLTLIVLLTRTAPLPDALPPSHEDGTPGPTGNRIGAATPGVTEKAPS